MLCLLSRTMRRRLASPRNPSAPPHPRTGQPGRGPQSRPMFDTELAYHIHITCYNVLVVCFIVVMIICRAHRADLSGEEAPHPPGRSPGRGRGAIRYYDSTNTSTCTPSPRPNKYEEEKVRGRVVHRGSWSEFQRLTCRRRHVFDCCTQGHAYPEASMLGRVEVVLRMSTSYVHEQQHNTCSPLLCQRLRYTSESSYAYIFPNT